MNTQRSQSSRSDVSGSVDASVSFRPDDALGSSFGSGVDAGNHEGKKIRDLIRKTEVGVGNLVQIFAAVNRKEARLRDRGDDLAAALLNFAHDESVQKTSQAALRSTSEAVALIQDYRHALVSRSEAKVVRPLSKYRQVCAKASALVQQKEKAWERQQDLYKKLDARMKQSPRQGSLGSFEVSQMQRRLAQQSSVAAQLRKNLDDQMLDFERQRTRDLKSALLEFLRINISFHAKAVQVLTKTSAHVDAVDAQSDMVDLHLQLHPDRDPGIYPSVSVTSLWNTPISVWGPQTLPPYTAGDETGDAARPSANSFYL